MASNDSLISKTVDDARSAKPSDDAATRHVMEEIYQIKLLDQGNPSRLKNDYNALSTKLHEQGLLPGLVISDSNANSVFVTDSNGKVQSLDESSFGKKLHVPSSTPSYDPAMGDQNPAKVMTFEEMMRHYKRFPYSRQ